MSLFTHIIWNGSLITSTYIWNQVIKYKTTWNGSLRTYTLAMGNKIHNMLKWVINLILSGYGTILVHFLYKYCWQYLYTSIVIIHFKRSHIENKFRQLAIFTFNLSIFLTRTKLKLNSIDYDYFSVLLWSFNEIVFLFKNTYFFPLIWLFLNRKTVIVDNTCIQVLWSYISRDPILKINLDSWLYSRLT
jgi:hypothetical protein